MDFIEFVKTSQDYRSTPTAESLYLVFFGKVEVCDILPFRDDYAYSFSEVNNDAIYFKFTTVPSDERIYKIKNMIETTIEHNIFLNFYWDDNDFTYKFGSYYLAGIDVELDEVKDNVRYYKLILVYNKKE